MKLKHTRIFLDCPNEWVPQRDSHLKSGQTQSIFV